MNIPRIKVLALVEADVVTGAAKSLLDFCRAAQEFAGTGPADVETSVATYVRPGGDENNGFITAARAVGLTVDIVPERFRFDPKVLGMLREVAARRQPDVIVSYHVKSHFLVRASGLARRYAWLPFHHGYTATDFKMLLYNKLDRISLPAAPLVLTVCEAFARQLRNEKGVRPERLRVQHNSIRPVTLDKAAGRAVLEKFGIAPQKKVILAAGRFSQEKGHVDLIEAFTQIDADAVLLLVGSGPERERMEQAAGSAADRIIYVGQVPDVGPYYAASDVMVLPSHSEGSPFVLLEAMAAGVPVVATAVGGVPEMVTHNESALLTPARQPAALADALARLLNDDALAQMLSANALQLIATRYAPKTYFRSLAAIYVEAALGNTGQNRKR